MGTLIDRLNGMVHDPIQMYASRELSYKVSPKRTPKIEGGRCTRAR